MALIHVREKGILVRGCADQKSGKEMEQRYCPQAMGSGGEVEQTRQKGNCFLADLK